MFLYLSVLCMSDYLSYLLLGNNHYFWIETICILHIHIFIYKVYNNSCDIEDIRVWVRVTRPLIVVVRRHKNIKMGEVGLSKRHVALTCRRRNYYVISAKIGDLAIHCGLNRRYLNAGKRSGGRCWSSSLRSRTKRSTCAPGKRTTAASARPRRFQFPHEYLYVVVCHTPVLYMS